MQALPSLHANGACRLRIASSFASQAPLPAVTKALQSRRRLRLTNTADSTSSGVKQSSASFRTTGMKLKGSCHCGAVKFEVDSKTPHPFMHCYCTICRKTQGGGGYTINIMVIAQHPNGTGPMADAETHARDYQFPAGGSAASIVPCSLWLRQLHVGLLQGALA